MTTAYIIHPDYLWPGLLPNPDGVHFFLVRRCDDEGDEELTQRIKSVYPGPKIVIVKEISPDLIERFKNVKRVTNVIDVRPTSIELQIAQHCKEITQGLMMWRNNQSFENPRGLTTCVTLPLYILEAVRALSNCAKFDASYGMLSSVCARFEEYLDIEDFDTNFQPINPKLIEKTVCDEMGFALLPRTIDIALFRHFLEHFPFEAASIVFDLEEFSFVTNCIETIVQALGSKDEEVVEEVKNTFPELPYELREFLLRSEKVVYVSTDDANSQTILQMKTYAPRIVHLGANPQGGAVDVIVIESECVETQHTILGHFFGNPKKLSKGGILCIKKPSAETVGVISSFEQQTPMGSLYCRLFEAYLRFERSTTSERGLLVVTKTD
jgi:hypothetical protein